MSPSDSQLSPAALRARADVAVRDRGASAPRRIHSSPTARGGSGAPSGSRHSISPSTALPTEPSCSSHSVPVITVIACSSVPPYSSSTFSGPSQPIHAS